MTTTYTRDEVNIIVKELNDTHNKYVEAIKIAYEAELKRINDSLTEITNLLEAS